MLIVDDNPFNIMVAETLFSEISEVTIEYESALNGQLAINKIREAHRQGKRPFEIIFLDLNMPVMDGFEVRYNNYPTVLIDSEKAKRYASEGRDFNVSDQIDCLLCNDRARIQTDVWSPESLRLFL